jgi:hypothetical protein
MQTDRQTDISKLMEAIFQLFIANSLTNGKVFPVLNYVPQYEDVRGVEAQLHVFLTSTLDTDHVHATTALPPIPTGQQAGP